ASGSGKSSFMRAGLLPRLKREDQHFIPIPVIRPERLTLSGDNGFVFSLQRAFSEAGILKSRADVKSAVDNSAACVRELLDAIVSAKLKKLHPGGDSAVRPPTVVISIDQAEELFSTESKAEAELFLKLLRELLLVDEPAIIALFTIRSDNYEPLQTAATL